MKGRPLVAPAAASRGRLSLMLLLLVAGTAAARAQKPAQQSRAQRTARTATADGRVVRPAGAGEDVQPVAGQRVVLHRVGSDSAGPLDSMLTDARGRFHFRYHPHGDDAIYFISARYAGIAYFSAPLQGASASDSGAEITVFDTTSRPLPLTVRGRHIVISAPEVDGTREALEVFELSNDSSITRVSADGVAPTWSTVVPAGATDLTIGQTDLSPETFRLDTGRVATVAPFAPGIRQFSFSFRLPPGDFPASFPMARAVSVLEVLLEEPAASVEGARLKAVSPVVVEGRSFQRFMAEDAPADAVARITVPAPLTASRRPQHLAIVAIAIGAAMVIVLLIALRRRARGRPAARRRRRAGSSATTLGSAADAPARAALLPSAMTSAPPPLPDESERLARMIADLDRAFESASHPSEEERRDYESRRAELKRQLAATLAAAPSAP